MGTFTQCLLHYCLNLATGVVMIEIHMWVEATHWKTFSENRNHGFTIYKSQSSTLFKCMRL